MTSKFSHQWELCGELGRWSEKYTLIKQIQIVMGFLLLTQPHRYTTPFLKLPMLCFKWTQRYLSLWWSSLWENAKVHTMAIKACYHLAHYLSDLILYDFPQYLLCSRHNVLLAVPQTSQAHTPCMGCSLCLGHIFFR